MIHDHPFIIVFGSIFLCTVWFKKTRPSAWASLVFGFIGTVTFLIGQTELPKFIEPLGLPIMNFCIYLGIPLVLIMPLLRTHRKFLVKKIMLFSITLNIILFFSMSFFWYRNCTALDRVLVNIHETKLPPVVVFNNTNKIIYGQVHSLIKEHIGGTEAEDFFIYDMRNDLSNTIVRIDWIDDGCRGYDVELDGWKTGAQFISDHFGPTEFIFDRNMRLISPASSNQALQPTPLNASDEVKAQGGALPTSAIRSDKEII